MFMDHWLDSSRELKSVSGDSMTTDQIPGRELESVGGGSMTMDQIPGRELESVGGGSGSGY